MASSERLVLVDGSAMIYRAFFAIPAGFSTSSGLATNATFGFASMFRKLFSGRRPDRGAVIFDAPGKTFRTEKFPEYKAQRPPMADELRAQLPWIDKVVEAHRFPILRVPGYEADDVIGTLARLGSAAGMEVLIVSGDKDFAQLVNDRIRMIDTLRDVTYDPELVRKKWGVPPERIVDFLALVGDKSDNVPGVPGIGAKGAAGLLDRFGSLTAILDSTEELKGRQKATLEENRDLALLCQDLVTIDQNVPLEVGLEALVLVDGETEEINALYKELEFYSFLSAEAADVAESSGDHRVLADLATAREWVTELPGAVAVMPVFDVPGPLHGGLVGLAVSCAAGESDYLPLLGPDGLGSGAVELLAEIFRADRRVIVHNGKALWVGLHRLGVELGESIDDVLLASFLIDPNKLIPHELGKIVKEYLQTTIPASRSVTGSGKKERAFSELPAAEIGPWAGCLADVVGRLWPVMVGRLEEAGQLAYLRDVEWPLSIVLGGMELDGILVDQEEIGRIGEEFRVSLAADEKTIHELAGRSFNIGSTKQLSTVLFEELGLPVIKKTKTGYSTNAEVLEKLADKGHEIAVALLRHRKMAKLINTYVEVLQRHASPTTGRVHPTFQQTTGVTGRLITTDPDLQRTPVKTAEGKRIREAFVPREGHVMISADWSQIELRLLAHVSADEKLVEAFRDGLDIHRRTAAELFGGSVELVTSKQRGVGKLVNFATIYGQGATALGQILKVPRKEAQSYIDGYFKAYSGVRSWLDETMAASHESGHVTTLLGRRRYIPELSSNSFIVRQAGERIAANTPIQGSAADICKLAMLRIAEDFEVQGVASRMILQIHDELLFEVPPGEVEAVSEIIRSRMEGVYPLSVPLVVDLGVGDSWAAAH